MAIAGQSIGERRSSLRLLLACGIAGPLVFMMMFLIEGATRPDYSPLRHPVSSLSIGELGWMQIASFIITGALLIAFALGVRRALRPATWGSLLLGLVGIGLIGSGIFVTDPLNGYPPGTALVPTARTTHGVLHDLFGIPVFLGLPITCVVFGRLFRRLGQRGWAIYSILAGVTMFVVFIPARAGFSQRAFADVAGLFQRLSLIVGLTWIVLLAVHVMRTPTQGGECLQPTSKEQRK
ncbi:MAG TPA: DUF998 domain-containing protein [Roseiflexaceae bacterium]|nr:DUF998 domain-containing protein [Roseiflexaceae bacterium]